MNIKEKMLRLHSVAFSEIPNDDYEKYRAKDSYLEGLITPITMYDVQSTYVNDRVVQCEVQAVTVVRFGVVVVFGSPFPSVSYYDHRKILCIGESSMFYMKKEDAEREVEYIEKYQAQIDAKRKLKKLVRKHLPEVLT